jgi:single-strand DNA-binding protein
MARISVVGNVTKEPELKFSQGGKPYLRFSVADNHRKKVGDKYEDDGATFYRVTSFAFNVETLIEHLTVGAVIKIKGNIRLEEYEKEGVKRASLEVVADSDIGGITLVVKPAKKVEFANLDEAPF